jgi:hypothetical protein
MGKTLGTMRVGGCTLRWERENATLAEDASGCATALAPAAGGLRPKPIASDADQAVLATRETALLADGGRFTLAEAFHGKEILRGFLVADRAALVGRDGVGLYDFAGGGRVALVEPGGGSRSELAVGTLLSLAVPFDDRLVVLRGDGASGVHPVRAGFPLLRRVGERFLAGGGSLLVLASAEEPGLAVSEETEGELRPDLAAFRGDLAAVPTRDRVYVVDGSAGAIRECPVEGLIASVAVSSGKVTVRSAGNRRTVFDRGGNRLG